MDKHIIEGSILLIVLIMAVFVISRWSQSENGTGLCNRKVIIYYLMIDERIDAEFCFYLRLVYRRDDEMWRSLNVPAGCAHRAQRRLQVLQKEFHGSEHKKVAGILHVLMNHLSVQKKHEVFSLPDSELRAHYYTFITAIKEEG